MLSKELQKLPHAKQPKAIPHNVHYSRNTFVGVGPLVLVDPGVVVSGTLQGRPIMYIMCSGLRQIAPPADPPEFLLASYLLVQNRLCIAVCAKDYGITLDPGTPALYSVSFCLKAILPLDECLRDLIKQACR